MNSIVWIVQALLAVIFALQGVVLISPPEPMKVIFDALPFSRGFMVAIGVLDVLGAVGLILPWALNTLAYVTMLEGDLESAASMMTEANQIIEATGPSGATYPFSATATDIPFA